MHERTELIADVVSCLADVATSQLPPLAANAKFGRLRERHRDASIDLVWEDESFDGSYHYDALVRPAGEQQTISVSVCPDDALPWALRGLQRWRDSDLLRVNETVLSVEEAISQLDVLWEKAPLMRRLIDSCIIEAELGRRNITVTQADIQVAFEEMRRRRGLLSAQAMRDWMRDSGVSLHALQDMAEKLARANKLRDLIVGENVDRYLELHAQETEVLTVMVLELPTAERAREFVELLSQEGTQFPALAQCAYVGDASGRTMLTYSKQPRYKLAEEFALTMPLAAGQTIASNESGRVLHVLSVEANASDDHARHRARVKLFDDWLREQRGAARIEWFWGDAKRTQAADAEPKRQRA